MKIKCLAAVTLAAGRDASPPGFVFDSEDFGFTADDLARYIERGLFAAMSEPIPAAPKAPAKPIVKRVVTKPTKGTRQ
jgi:hypothetical protein